MRVLLRDLAHSRSGDKSNINTLSVIAYEEPVFDWLRQTITIERVRDTLAFRVTGEVVRFELPGVRTLLFVVQKNDTDTVTTSTWADGHGKSLSSALLQMVVEVPEHLLVRSPKPGYTDPVAGDRES